MRRPMFAALLVAVAGPLATADDPKKPNYYPLAKGNKWEYRVDVNGTTVDATTEVTKVREVDGKRVFICQAKVAQTLTSEELSADEKGVYRHSYNGVPTDKPLTVIPYPPKAGMKWTEKLKLAGLEIDLNGIVKEPAEVKVPAGTYKTVPVELAGTVMGQKLTTTVWYADGVGPVKQIVTLGGVEFLMELKKFTPAK